MIIKYIIIFLNLYVPIPMFVNNIHISYSYDHNLQAEIMQHSYGTHEIGISMRIKTLASQRHIGFWSY